MEINHTNHLLLYRQYKDSFFYKVEIPLQIDSQNSSVDIPLTKVITRRKIKKDLGLNKMYFQEQHCKLLENPEQYFLVIKELNEDNDEVFIAVVYNQDFSFEILNHDIVFSPLQQLLLFDHQSLNKNLLIWDELVDEKQFKIDVGNMVYSSNKNLPFISRDNTTITKYGANQVLACSILQEMNSENVALKIAVSRIEDEFEGQYNIVKSNIVINKIYNHKIQLINCFAFNQFLLVFARYETNIQLENKEFKNHQIALVVHLKEAENLLSEAELHYIINMNDDFEICKYSQPQLFAMGEFNVARIQCIKIESYVKNDMEKERQNKEIQKKQREEDDENMDDDSNDSNSGFFGENSYGVESDEEVKNNDQAEHELLNAPRLKPEIINEQWWFVDLYFNNELFLNKQQLFSHQTHYFQVHHPSFQ